MYMICQLTFSVVFEESMCFLNDLREIFMSVFLLPRIICSVFLLPRKGSTFTGWPIVITFYTKFYRNDALQNMIGPVIVQCSSPIMQSGYFINNFLISLVKLERHHKIHQQN